MVSLFLFATSSYNFFSSVFIDTTSCRTLIDKLPQDDSISWMDNTIPFFVTQLTNRAPRISKARSALRLRDSACRYPTPTSLALTRSVDSDQ